MFDVKFKAAVVQAAPAFLDLPKAVAKTVALIDRAAAEGAKLIAFPETWIPGYPWFIWMGAPPFAGQFLARYHQNSLRIDSPEMQTVRDAARKAAIHVLLGFSERDHGSLYIAQCLIDPQGEILFARRKLKPTHVERTVFGEGDGADFQVADTACGRVGALCCWEHMQPLSKFAMFSLHEQVHVAAWPSFAGGSNAPYALSGQANMTLSQAYALEGQCFVLASTALMSQEMVEILRDVPLSPQIDEGATGGGYAMIFGPDGRPLCESLGRDEEGLIYAEIDTSLIVLAKGLADPVGHYSRPDVVRLLVNRTRSRPVQQHDDTPEMPFLTAMPTASDE